MEILVPLRCLKLWEYLFYMYKTKTGLLLSLLYRSIFLQHDAPFPCFISCVHRQFFLYQVKDLVFTLFPWRSVVFLIPSIRKLFPLDLSSRSTKFLQISNAHVGYVVCITPMSSFVELSSFSRFCAFSFMFKNLWSICF